MDQPRTAPLPAPAAPPALRWDIFCRVIDNLGDIGVCWRLCAALAAHNQRVRLWIDQPEPLAWMAPGALEGRVQGVQVLHWSAPLPSGDDQAAEVWVEAFGCEPPGQLIEGLATQLQAGAAAPVWINLEYLSAEAYVERSHRLPSLVSSGPLRGLGKWFFYPGFTPRTGGLLCENDLLQRQTAWDAVPWLEGLGLGPAPAQGGESRRVSLFCYEPAALPAVLQQAGQDATAADWLVTPGRASAAVAAAQAQQGAQGPGLRLRPLPTLSQRDFDHLLWSCDLNLVRGEDSLVRALWAGKPLVWHIYPQDDQAHHAKLDAFLDWLQAPASLRAFHHAWNGIGDTPARWPGWEVIESWRPCVLAARARLLTQPDLVTQLLGFVAEKR